MSVVIVWLARAKALFPTTMLQLFKRAWGPQDQGKGEENREFSGGSNLKRARSKELVDQDNGMDVDPQGGEEPHPKRRKIAPEGTNHPSYCEPRDIEALEAAKQQNSEPDQYATLCVLMGP